MHRDEENERDTFFHILNVMPIISFYSEIRLLSWQKSGKEKLSSERRFCRRSSQWLLRSTLTLYVHMYARVYREVLVSGAHSKMTFELVHVASNDIRFPLIYRFERVYLVDISRTIVGQFYPWISLFSTGARRGATSRTVSVCGIESVKHNIR